jgi:hypothetical protein
MKNLITHLHSTLVEGLPDSLKSTIDAALELGCEPDEILRRVQAQAGGTFTAMGVEAYLKQKTQS